jgi:hypothetical protein
VKNSGVHAAIRELGALFSEGALGLLTEQGHGGQPKSEQERRGENRWINSVTRYYRATMWV